MTRLRLLAFVSLASGGGIAIAACVSSMFSEGQFACTPGGADTCPPGLICARDGRCRASDVVPEIVRDSGSTPDVTSVDAGVDCPDARFNVTLDGREPHAVLVTTDGRVFAGGVQAGQGWLAELHPCDGRIIHERTVSGASSFEVLTVSGEEIVAAGNAPVSAGEGTGYGRFGRDLATIAFTPVGGYGGGADYATIGSDGAIWLSGKKGATGFFARTEKCSLDLLASPGGILTTNNSAIAIVRGTTAASFERVAASDCKREDGGVNGTIRAGTSNVQPRALVATATGFAALGSATTLNANTLVWIATSTGNSVWDRAEIDPNPFDPDEARALSYDGDALFLAVSQRASGTVGTPTIYRFTPTVTKDSVPVWSALPFGATLLDIRAIATAKGREGVFVVATGATAGGFARCTKNGECK